MRATETEREFWKRIRVETTPFARPAWWRSVWQLVNTFIPMFGFWLLALWSLDHSYLLTILFGLVCAGMLIRITIIQHDCGHFAFFRSRRANTLVGHFCGLFNLAPLCFWHRQHAKHHSAINNLDRGDRGLLAECLTVREYQALSRRDRVIYRITRSPLVFYPVISPLALIFATRFPGLIDRSYRKDRRNIQGHNVALLVLYGGVGLLVGFQELLLTHLPLFVVATAAGSLLDSLGHKFPGARWVHGDEWTWPGIALDGCGYLDLPPFLQWFSGNIGIHHVHHLDPKIPNYFLEDCLRAAPSLQTARAFSLREGIRAAWYVLWDEDRQRLIKFSELPASTESIEGDEDRTATRVSRRAVDVP